MAIYAKLVDVTKRLGRPISDPNEMAQVEAWLEDVETIIIGGFARSGLILADQVPLDDPSAATLARIEAEAVIRRIRNAARADNPTSITRSVDDGSITERHEGDRDSDAWLLDADWIELLPAFSSGAFSTRPGFAPDYQTAYPWV